MRSVEVFARFSYEGGSSYTGGGLDDLSTLRIIIAGISLLLELISEGFPLINYD